MLLRSKSSPWLLAASHSPLWQQQVRWGRRDRASDTALCRAAPPAPSLVAAALTCPACPAKIAYPCSPPPAVLGLGMASEAEAAAPAAKNSSRASSEGYGATGG